MGMTWTNGTRWNSSLWWLRHCKMRLQQIFQHEEAEYRSDYRRMENFYFHCTYDIVSTAAPHHGNIPVLNHLRVKMWKLNSRKLQTTMSDTEASDLLRVEHPTLYQRIPRHKHNATCLFQSVQDGEGNIQTKSTHSLPLEDKTETQSGTVWDWASIKWLGQSFGTISAPSSTICSSKGPPPLNKTRFTVCLPKINPMFTPADWRPITLLSSDCKTHHSASTPCPWEAPQQDAILWSGQQHHLRRCGPSEGHQRLCRKYEYINVRVCTWHSTFLW
jgi:hypothetical protein